RSLARRVEPILDRYGLSRRSGAAQRMTTARGIPGDDEADFPDGALPHVRPRPSTRTDRRKDATQQLSLA
ncbi:MAG: radical SAM protein, partial [Actinomycetota bacterium]|nr:radical SAM protein [Actinomycetota bacterium]